VPSHAASELKNNIQVKMAIPYYRITEVDRVVKDQPSIVDNMKKKQQSMPLKQGDSSDEECSELSFQMIVKTKPSPSKVREFLQACADKMNSDDTEDDDFE